MSPPTWSPPAGADALVVAAARALDAGEPVAALHLTDIVLAAEPNHGAARAVAADCIAFLARLECQFLGAGVAETVGPTIGGSAMNHVTFDFSDASVLVTGRHQRYRPCHRHRVRRLPGRAVTITGNPAAGPTTTTPT